MRKKLETKFDFKDIAELRSQFEQKNWNNFEEFDGFFENFCSLSEHLDDDQSELVMELTKEFLSISDVSYIVI